MTNSPDAATLRPLGSKMQGLRFHGVGDLRLEELPVPDPGPGEVRIRPLAAGVCGTDAHILQGEFPAAAPVVLGHEVAGLVEAVGADVKGFREGDFVTVQPNTFCTVCRFCRTGREHLCPELRGYGVHANGGFAEGEVVPAKVVYHLPATLEPRVGCLAEPLACCIHGMDKLGMQSGAAVLVLGAGMIGLMLTRLARLAGAGMIVVSEPEESRRQDALAFGADHVMDPQDSNWKTAMEEATGGLGFDAVIDAVGSSRTFEQGVSLAARGGTVLVFGVAPMQATASVRPYDIFSRELTVVGALINPFTHERAVHLLPQMGLEKLRIAAFPLAEFKQAFEVQAAGTATKVEILPQQH
jgi:L-iditol 2-dehydrogenase